MTNNNQSASLTTQYILAWGNEEVAVDLLSYWKDYIDAVHEAKGDEVEIISAFIDDVPDNYTVEKMVDGKLKTYYNPVIEIVGAKDISKEGREEIITRFVINLDSLDDIFKTHDGLKSLKARACIKLRPYRDDADLDGEAEDNSIPMLGGDFDDLMRGVKINEELTLKEMIWQFPADKELIPTDAQRYGLYADGREAAALIHISPRLGASGHWYYEALEFAFYGHACHGKWQRGTSGKQASAATRARMAAFMRSRQK